MKNFFYLVLMVCVCACSGTGNENENCKFLLNLDVNVYINLSLPQYSQLQYVSNSVYIANVGNAGIIVSNIGSGFMAWDASDPNHSPNNSCHLEISGLEATCSCGDENTYSLVTGQPLNSSTLVCGLKNYRVEQSGNTLLVSN